MVAQLRAEVVLSAGADVGEGPVWDARDGRLVWVDITNGEIHRTEVDTGSDEVWRVGQMVGAAVPRARGGFVAAVEAGFVAVDGDGRVHELARVEDDQPGNRMNDGGCDAAGRLWAGTMAFDLTPGAGALYRLDPGGRVVTVLSEVTLSNGLGWAPDGRVMYFIDSMTQGVDAFDFDADRGTVRNRRRLIDVEGEAGMPDGLTVDAEGGIWVALWGGGAVRRYTPAGRLDRVLALPVTQVTSCGFGGPDLDQLFVTSAAYRLSAQDRAAQPHAGALFRCEAGVPGLPAHAFAG